jgi:serine/threonine protein phosphatase PrpC
MGEQEESQMQIQAFGKSDVGKVREGNEDYMLIDEALGLYIVCDGMGGHNAGEIASENTAKIVREEVARHADFLEVCDESATSCKRLVNIVRNAIETACGRVFQMAVDNSAYQGMGTTITMVLSVGKKAVLGHVGDSCLYLQREQKIYKLSSDHTLAAELLAQGALTSEEAHNHPTSNILTRAIGLQQSVKVDALLFDLLPGDTFLLCSDGLDSVHEPEELSQLLGEDELSSIPNTLIGLANQRDGSDNVTTVVGRVIADDADPHANAWKREVQLRLDTLQQVYLFQFLSFRELTKVMGLVEVASCETGDVLIHEGETSDSLFLTIEGELVVSRGGQEITVLGAGSHVGEMALLNQRPRSATVRAVEPSRLIVLEREALFELLREDPGIGVKLMWALAQSLSQRLDETNAQFFGTDQLQDSSITPFS